MQLSAPGRAGPVTAFHPLGPTQQRLVPGRGGQQRGLLQPFRMLEGTSSGSDSLYSTVKLYFLCFAEAISFLRLLRGCSIPLFSFPPPPAP